MIRRSSLIAMEIMLGLVAALLIGLGTAWWRLSQGPVELNFIRQTLQTELSAARAGRPVGIERVELAWSRAGGGALELHAVGVTVEDGARRVLSRFDDARIELSLMALLTGRVALERADFSGGAISLTRKLDGALHVAFGPPGTPPDIIVPAANDNLSLEARVARLLDGMAAAFRPVGPGGQLDSVSVQGARLSINDETGGGSWTANDAAFELARADEVLVMQASAHLEGARGPAPAQLRITTDTAFQAAIIEFGTQNVRPRALFSAAALGPFEGLDAPLTATISVGLDRRSGVNRIEGDATLGPGVAEMAGGQFRVSGGRMHGRYDLASDELIIDDLNLAGGRTRINGEIRVHQASAIMRAEPGKPAPFDIALPAATLDAPGMFTEPVDFANVQASGVIDAAAHEIRFTELDARAGAATIDADGRLYWAATGEDRVVRPGVALRAAVTGADTRTVLRFWPIGLGEGTRSYLAESLTTGRVSDASVNLDIRPSDVAASQWRAEAVDIRFNLHDAEMRFINTMSPVTHARASAVLRGNSFAITIHEGKLNDLNITRGVIEIPRLRPQGQMLLNARVEGEARRLIEVLMQRPLALRDKLPVDPATVTGRGWVNLRMQRPNIANVPFEQYRFNIEGKLENFAGSMTTRQVALSEGQLDVRGDQSVIRVSGPIRAGASTVRIAWNEFLNREGRASSEYEIAGEFDADDLVQLGYPIAEYAQGRVGVIVNGQGRGFDVDQANVQVDLRDAAVTSPWRFWTKRTGQVASARFDIARQPDGTMAFNNLDARGAGLVAQGRVRTEASGRIVEANLPRLAIEGRSDAHLYALRAADGGLDVSVRGAMFDGAPFMDGDNPPAAATPRPARVTRVNRAGAQTRANAQTRASAAAPTPAVAAAPPPPRQPRRMDEPLVRASVMVDRLKLRGGATLSNARVTVTAQQGALALLIAEGRSPSNKPFSVALGVRPDDPAGRLRMRSEDAGFAMRALTGADNILGGTAAADGDWRVGPPTVSHLTVQLRDFQVVRLPAMARLLSSAGSLTGLVEMLNGDGIGFSSLDAPLVYTDGRLTFSEARMAGPSLGLTASGAYNITADNLHVDGVVVPSYGLNSMLGAVPILGDLLVSRRGEGIVGMTYSVNGRVAEPRVGVNPLSALTPGILRRIFEPIQRSAPRTRTPQRTPPAAAPPANVTAAPPAASLSQQAAPGAVEQTASLPAAETPR